MESGIRTLMQYYPWMGRVDVNKDPEAAAKIRSKLMPSEQNLVDTSRMVNVGDPDVYYSTLGVNFQNAPDANKKLVPPTFEQKLKLVPRDYAISEAQYEKFEKPSTNILGIGSGASPQTFAHEARHNAITNEYINRIHDIMGSNSAPQYQSNINAFYHNYFVAQNPNKYSNKDSFADKESRVLEDTKSSMLRVVPEYKWGNSDFVDTHKLYNQSFAKGEEPGTWDKLTTHPIDYITGNEVETSKGVLPKTMLEERNKFPFLNFVGSDPGPVSSGMPGDMEPKFDPNRNYKRGGAVERTTHDRKMI